MEIDGVESQSDDIHYYMGSNKSWSFNNFELSNPGLCLIDWFITDQADDVSVSDDFEITWDGDNNGAVSINFNYDKIQRDNKESSVRTFELCAEF